MERLFPDGFDAEATLSALESSPVRLRGAEDGDAARVRRLLYLRALADAATAEADALKDGVLDLVLSEDGNKATVCGFEFSVTYRKTYDYPQAVIDAKTEYDKRKKYHERPENIKSQKASLVIKAAR